MLERGPINKKNKIDTRGIILINGYSVFMFDDKKYQIKQNFSKLWGKYQNIDTLRRYQDYPQVINYN